MKKMFFLHSLFGKISVLSMWYTQKKKKKKKLKRKTFSQPCVFHKSLHSKSLQFLSDITELQGKTLEKL